jgi:WD40 repeat protein
MQAYRYWAFISYSSKDQHWATWLIGALETYRIPSGVAGRQTQCGTVPRRLVPVFRDRDELRSGPDLEAALDCALAQSRFLVVICSPNSARPNSWVNREILAFKKAGRQDDIIALIVDGEPHASQRPESEALECFPEALRHEVDNVGGITAARTEPLAADIRREDSQRRVSCRKALLKLVARIVDVDFDDLWQRDRQRRRQRLAALGASAAVSIAVLAGLIATGLTATRTELSARLAKQATTALADKPTLALLLSVSAWETSPTAAAYGSLLTTVRKTPHLLTSVHGPATAGALAISRDGRRLAVAGCLVAGCANASIFVYDVDTGRATRAPIEPHAGKITGLEFHPRTGHLFVVEDNADVHRVVSFDTSGVDPLPVQVYRDSRSITSFAISRDGSFYAVAMTAKGRFNEVKLFPDSGGRRCGDDGDAPMTVMAFSSDARQLAIAGEFGRIHVLDTATCRARSLFHGRRGDLAFDESGRYLIAFMPDGTSEQWDLSRVDPPAEHLAIVTVPINGYLHVLSADAAYLASQHGADVLLFDVATRRRILEKLRDSDVGLAAKATLQIELKRLQPVSLRGHKNKPTILRFSADDRVLVTADARGQILVWNVREASLVSAEGRLRKTSASAMENMTPTSPDGRIAASVSEQASGCEGDFKIGCRRTTRLTLRKVETGEMIDTLDASRAGLIAVEPSESLSVGFTPEGNVVTRGLTGDGRLTAKYEWRVNPQSLVNLACRRANQSLSPSDPELERLVQGWRSWLVATACPSDVRPR